MYITVDNQVSSATSLIDWTRSTAPVQHSFDAVGAVPLRTGNHIARLIGTSGHGSFVVEPSANLSVLVHPANVVRLTRLRSRSRRFDLKTRTYYQTRKLPSVPLLALQAPRGQDTVAVGSGAVSLAGPAGDATLSIYWNGKHPGDGESLWSANDLCSCSEVTAPFYVHAFLPARSSGGRISLDAGEFPWGSPSRKVSASAREDPVVYRVRPGSTLIELSGGLVVAGAGQSVHRPLPGLASTPADYVGVGSSVGWPGVPRTGSAVVLAQQRIRIPPRHSGTVMFLAKSRVQADPSDQGGVISLWISIDGRVSGSVGKQELARGDAASQRTISASYLAAGAGVLSPGSHLVRVYARAIGRFKHVALVRDLPLVWFD
jgi:hypothetical protein